MIIYVGYERISKQILFFGNTLENAEWLLREYLGGRMGRYCNVKILPCKDSLNNRHFRIDSFGKPQQDIVIQKRVILNYEEEGEGD